MIYALYYKNKLQYKRACKDLATFKKAVYNKRVILFDNVKYTDKYKNFNKVFNRKYSNTVDFWTIRTYKNYKAVNEVIKESETGRKGKQKKVANYFYVFDTETTNYKNEYAFCYLYGIRKYNFNYNLNDDNIEEYAEEYQAFHSKNAIKEFSNYLFKINQDGLKNDELIYIYVHNLQFDLYELIQNIFSNFTYTPDDYTSVINDSIFRGAATKPLRFRFKNLVFIDSLALTNKSLKKISEKHKIKKQTELKTYKEQYFFGSVLPSEELIYNKYDLDVTALGIMDSIRSLKTEFNTFNEYVKTYVSTVTGASKYLNKHIYSDEKQNKTLINEHTARASNNLPLKDNKIDTDRLLFRQAVFKGGFTHANIFEVYNTLQAIQKDMIYISYDKKSHYPSTMCMRRFPYKFNEITENKTELLKTYHNENLESIGFDNQQLFINSMLNHEFKIIDKKIYRSYFSPVKHYFNCEITLQDVEIKIYNGFNCMPLIAVSESDIKGKDYFNKNNVIDNGKILKAKKIKIKCTCIDLLTYSMFYNFTITDCSYLEYTHIVKMADNFIQKTIRYHLVNKNEIDNCIKGKKEIESLTDFSGNQLFSDMQLSNYNSLSDSEKDSFLTFEYQLTKTCGLNNQYGILVQKIINDNIMFDLKQYKYIKEDNVIQGCRGTQTTRDYVTGMYITAYARLDLAFMTYLLYVKLPNVKIVYWDTDSIKVKCNKADKSKVEKLFNFYNSKIKKVRDDCISEYGELYNLGIWENDGEYQAFYTMGAKKYIVLENDKIKVTNAGINKKQFSAALTEYYNEYKNKGLSDFDAFISVLNYAYHPNLIIGTDVSGRKTITYPNIKEKKIKLNAVDENGKELTIYQYPTALIRDCDYSLTDINGNHLLNRLHFQLAKALQLSIGYQFECNLKINSIGTLSNNLTDEKDNFYVDNLY